MSDPHPVPLAHAVNFRVLLVVIGGLVVGGALLDAAGSVVRRQMEDQSWAEERCAALVPTDTAETEEHWTCVQRKLRMSDVKAVLPQLRLAVAGAALVISGVVLVRRHRQGRRGRVMAFANGSV